MKIRIGFDIVYECLGETPMVLMLNVHPSRQNDLLVPDKITFTPWCINRRYIDRFGNLCTRVDAPAGEIQLTTNTIIVDTGRPDEIALEARQYSVTELPNDVLQFLMPSRYCEADRLMNIAWSLFSGTAEGWHRVQAICDFVNSHIRFDYSKASPQKSAYDVFSERQGVCRDFTHLAVTFCRCMNIPARYCTGYLGDIGVPHDPAPMDFSAWFEVFLGGDWFTFDARHNIPRIGRILIARGRDAADVAISTSFGANVLKKFDVVTDELVESASSDQANLERYTKRWYGVQIAN